MKLSGKDIAARIEALRIDRGETREEIANLLGKNRQIFIDWRNCDRILSVEDLTKLSLHYGVSMEYIVTGKDKLIDDDIALIDSKIKLLSPDQRKPVKAIVDSLVELWHGGEF